MLNNFIYARKKALFLKALDNNEVLDEAIVFIEDTKEIWNRGTYFDCSTISDLEAIRQGAAKGATALQSYTEQYKGTVTGVKINGTTKNPLDGVVDLGTVITSHQDISGKQDKLVSGTNIKTINNTSILGNGNINVGNISIINTDLELIDHSYYTYYYIYYNNYFTIEALEDGLTAKLSINECEYRVDGGDWTTLSANTNTVVVNKGQKLQFKIYNPLSGSLPTIGTFTISKKCNVSGNIMSLLYGDDFLNNITLNENRPFGSLFRECTNIISANNLILPATTLVPHCYTLMFYGCTSLTTAPELPATTLASNCYSYMFYNCKNLTTASELPATTLANYCYRYMFNGCGKLNYIKMLATDISATDCLYNWVSGVSDTGTFVKSSSMISLPTSINGIPSGWTVENV